MSEVAVVPDVAAAAAELFLESTAGAVAARGRALVALTGGGTAAPLYEKLRSDLKAREDWEALKAQYPIARTVGGAIVRQSTVEPKHFACPSCGTSLEELEGMAQRVLTAADWPAVLAKPS